MNHRPLPPGVSRLISAWAIMGTALLLLEAVVRLSLVALDAMVSVEVSALQMIVAAGWIVFNTYVEGYRAFHRRFIPRTVARAMALPQHGRWVDFVLAPLVVMGLWRATRRLAVTSWIVVLGVVVLVLAVRSLPQPWRGIVDAGVVTALGVGLVSLGVQGLAALMGHPAAVDPEFGTTASKQTRVRRSMSPHNAETTAG